MTSAQVVETSVTVTDNSPFLYIYLKCNTIYVNWNPNKIVVVVIPHPDDHTTQLNYDSSSIKFLDNQNLGAVKYSEL